MRWLWRTVRSPFTRLNRWRRLLRLRRSGVDHTWWWLDSPWFITVKVIAVAFALLFLAWLVRALLVLIAPGIAVGFLGFDPDPVCRVRSVECGALTGWVTSLLSIALASAVFLLWRLGRLRRRYLRTARRHPRELVPTAGTMIGRVVGRDQLCRVGMEDLRVRRTRRPHVLVGGVGTGKTAVLVQLTELLARRHAVPVPIRLRGAATLDFTELAKQQFIHELDPGLSSPAEGEKVWRRLLQDGRIVVLADGLEEALTDGSAGHDGGSGKPADRDTQIRKAIQEAHKRQLPLFIASRPHTPLRGMDATIHELEPLSEVDALSYITQGNPSEDDWRLSWIVEMADVAEAPLYLQITRELSDHDLLDDIVRREDQILRARAHDKSSLRLRLLQKWEDALVHGNLHPQVPLDRAERELTLDWIAALACTGLMNDSLQVSLDEELPPGVGEAIRVRTHPQSAAKPVRHGLKGIDLRLAATWGMQFGLVELSDDQVRFEHSLIQAYLGSRLLDLVLRNDGYWRTALGQDQAGTHIRPRPGREFLIALVLHSRYAPGEAWPTGRSAGAHRVPPVSRQEICARLRAAAQQHYDNKALDIYAAALEIAGTPADLAATSPQPPSVQYATVTATRAARRRHLTVRATAIEVGTRPAGAQHDGSGGGDPASLPGIGTEILRQWDEIRSDDLHTLEEAKIGLVCRFGDALRTQGEHDHSHTGALGYQQLYDICCREESYRVRLAGAQEIGKGGCAAYRELSGHLGVHSARQWAGGEQDGRYRPAADRAPGGRQSWAWQVTAWLVPLLVTSVPGCPQHGSEEGAPAERATLEDWLGHLRPGGGRPTQQDWPVAAPEPVLAGAGCGPHDRLRIYEEIALAQGFKYAANRRHTQLHTRPGAWAYLEGKALEMLRDASYWFSELTLIQALALWALPEEQELPEESPEPRHLSSSHGRPRANPDETVERWLDIVASKPQAGTRPTARRVHPFVAAAADMANRALAVQQPGRFLWMDESDVVSRIGAGQPRRVPSSARKPSLWIPPSMGWSALDPEAQQLLADVLLLLNLAERGEKPAETEHRLLQANAHGLPPCLTRDRRPLQPLLTVGSAGTDQHGDSCLDGCRFQLCPYPPKGLQHHRTELSEEFCRRQYRLVRRFLHPTRHTARWQGMAAGRLRVFWAQMAERARNSPG